MAASLSAAVRERLSSAFAAVNAASQDSNKISVYDAMIPGVPTSRYCVVYAGSPRRGSSTADGESRDRYGRFQVTVAATDTGSQSSPAPITDRLVSAVLDALDGAQLEVTGMYPFTVQQADEDTYPIAVEVVKDRVTVEHALIFTFIADRA